MTGWAKADREAAASFYSCPPGAKTLLQLMAEWNITMGPRGFAAVLDKLAASGQMQRRKTYVTGRRQWVYWKTNPRKVLRFG